LAMAMKVARRNKLYDRQLDLCSTASMLYYEMGQYDRALRWIEKTRVIAQTLGNRTRVAHSMIQIGMNLQMMGRYHDAIRYARAAMRLLSSDVTEHIRTRIIIYLAEALVTAFDDGAKEAHQAMMAMFPKMRALSDRAFACSVDAKYKENAGLKEAALEAYRDTRRLYEEIGYLDDKTRAEIRIARIAAEMRDHATFNSIIAQIEKSVAKMESVNILGEAITARILGALAMPGGAVLTVLVDEARDVRPTDVSVRLELNRALALAGIELGDAELARVAASGFYADIKAVVAGMDDLAASSYLRRSGAEEFMARYAEWIRARES